MIRFLFKGVLRDKNRSVLPILVVTAGVFLTVLANCWIGGVMVDMLEFNANFETGHVSVMTKAYAEYKDQVPNDLALLNVSELKDELNEEFPDMEWAERIKFGGLLDIPDENGETRAQGPVTGMAVDLLSPGTREIARMDIEKALVRGRLPENPGEILISEEFANKLDVDTGEQATLMGSTMYGGMTFYNFTIAGTIEFGVVALDRGAIITDIRDAQKALDMVDACGELLGYLPGGEYNEEEATRVANAFNARHEDSDDEYAPVMWRLQDHGFIGGMYETVKSMVGILIFVFVAAMSIVLWNTGLIGGLRRYGEVGVRLAIGETKGHVYRSMIYESVLIGIAGSILGTALGLLAAYPIQEHGLDFSGAMQSSTMMMQTTFRAKISASAYYIGFIPGLFSTVLGTMLSGIGIYRRNTARLFKELEV